MKRLLLPLLALAAASARAEDPATNAPVAGAAEFNGAAPPAASDEDSFFSIPERAAPLAPPYGCAGDVDLDPGDAILVGNLRAPRRSGAPPRNLALLLETSARSPASDEIGSISPTNRLTFGLQ